MCESEVRVHDNNLIFNICAICAYEGPVSEFDLICEFATEIEKAKFSECYNSYLARLHSGDHYDQVFATALTEELNDAGMLKGLDSICSTCQHELKKPTKVTSSWMDQTVDSDLVDEPEDDIDHTSPDQSVLVQRNPGIPKRALFLGLFPGIIPTELQDLSLIEISMISLYSNLTRISMQAGVHYHANPTTYTVVNDLTTVLDTLPAQIDMQTFAILRHRTSKRVKQYQFRPSKVRDALLWLVENNKHYASLTTNFSTTINWNCNEQIDIDNLNDILLDDEDLKSLYDNSAEMMAT